MSSNPSPGERGAHDVSSEEINKLRADVATSELEGMARRNPLGTIAGALLVGVIIGMISRSRS
jgi:hypothetical protein